MTQNQDQQLDELAAMDREALDHVGPNRWKHRALGVVLAGGQSSRMGGHDKAVIEIDGQSMLGLCVDRLAPQVGQVVISGNPRDETKQRALQSVPDLVPDFAGPLAGILSTMRWAETHAHHCFWIISVAVDTPFFPTNLVDRFIMAMGGPEPSIVLAQSGDRLHPTFGLWPIALADDLEAYLASGERKTRLWAEKHICSHAHFPGTVIDEIEIDPFFQRQQTK